MSKYLKSISLEASRLLGRGSAGGTGTPEAIMLGVGVVMTGTTLSTTPVVPVPTAHTKVNITGTTTIATPTNHTEYFMTGNGPYTVTLQLAAAVSGFEQWFKRVSGTGVVTVSRAGADTIDTFTSVTLALDDAELLTSDGVLRFNRW